MTEKSEDLLDLFESGLGCVFDEPLIAIGSPGELYEHTFETNLRSKFSDAVGTQELMIGSTKHSFNLKLPTPKEVASNALMAHHIWQAAFVICREIASGFISVDDSLVVELGAGHGLCSLVAAKCGARQLMVTDYPDDGIISALEANITHVVGVEHKFCKENASGVWWDALGHAWGNQDSLAKIISRVSDKRVVLLLADLLWMPAMHAPLLSDVEAILKQATKSSRVYVTAGLHTSRDTIDSFVRKARELFGLCVLKIGEVKVGAFGLEDGIVEVGEDVSEEQRALERSDPSERKKWVIFFEMKVA